MKHPSNTKVLPLNPAKSSFAGFFVARDSEV